MICARCSHAQADHATGRCSHSTMQFVAAVGGTVTERCDCKAFVSASAGETTASRGGRRRAVVETTPEPEPEVVAEVTSENEDEPTAAI